MTQPSHQARKRFGQHFLHDPRVIGRIADAINPQAGEHLVEIGPGLGALTDVLLHRGARLDAVELDRDLVARLQQSYPPPAALTLHQSDALQMDFCRLRRGNDKLRVIGNLPYNISTPLIFHLLSQAHCIMDMCFMLQKEVVQRLSAQAGNKHYGRLSVMVQWYCQVEKLFDVGPGAFQPPPKVDSAIVRLVPRLHAPTPLADEAMFSTVVRAAFAQRRKTLRNTLKGLVDADDILACGIEPSARAETLGLKQFAALSNCATTKR